MLDEHSSLTDVYTHLDLPLVSVLLRMEQNGVRVDQALLREMSSRLAVTIDDLAERIYASIGPPVQYQFAEAAWRCAVQQDGPAQAA